MQPSAEAINPTGAGNSIINYGLIKAGASSAIFFQNTGTTAASPRNLVDNFGTIDARGGANPVTGGQAIGSFNDVGIDIINEVGGSILGNLDLQGGDDRVTLKTNSVITGNLDGGGGTNTLNLDAASGASDSLAGVVQNFQTLNKTGAGTWTLTGSVGQSSGAPLAVDVLAGTLQLTGDNTGFNGNVSVSAGATLEARAQSLPPLIGNLAGQLLLNQPTGDNAPYAGQVIGTGFLTKIGGGTVALTGSNTYSGGTFFNQGALAAGADSALGAATGPLTFNGGTLTLLNSFNLAATRSITLNAASGGYAGGGTIDTNGFQTTVAQGIAGAGGLTIADGSGTNRGVATLTGTNTYAGGTTISAGTLQLGNGGTTGSIVGNVTDNGNLAFNRSDATIFSGTISGTGIVSQIGAGSSLLTAANTYSGGTALAAGTLIAGNAAALGTGPLVVAANPSGTTTLDNTAGVTTIANPVVLTQAANLIAAGNNPLTLSGTISGAGALTKNGAATLILSADNTYTGGTAINAGTLQVGNGGAAGSVGTGPILDNAALVFNRSGTVAVPGAITGTGSLTQNGVAGGTLLLTGANTYAGGTTISAGTVQIGNGGTTGSIVGNVSDNGTLAFNRSDTVTFPGTISGTGNFVQSGTGTTILTAANPYTGGTTISAGTLQIGNGGVTGSIVGDVTDNGTLAFNRSDTTTFPGTITGTGGVVQSGTGTTILTAANTYAGGTTIGAGTLQLGAGGTTGSIVGNVTDNGTLAFNRGDTVTFPGTISGSGGVVQSGTGTTILTAANPYTGGTTISTGTLAVGDAAHPGASLSGGGATFIAAAATLAGYGSVTGPVVNNGTIAVANALGLFSAGPNGALTINGNLQNNGLLNVTSSGLPGNVMQVNGNYTAGAGSSIALKTVLNAGGPLSNQITDRLLITGSADPSTVRINAIGPGAFTATGAPDAAHGISIIQVAGAASENTFTLPGGYVSGGTPFQYRLYAYGPGSSNGPAYAPQSLVGNSGNTWDFRLQNAYVDPDGPVPPVTPPVDPDPENPSIPPVRPGARAQVAPQVPAYVTIPTALFNAGFQDIDSLHRRLGEIRDDQIQGRDQQGEVFVRSYGSRFNYTSSRSFADYGFNSSQDYAAVQFGGNWLAINNNAGTFRAGMAGTIGQLWIQPSAVDGASKGFFNTQSLAGTATWQSRGGWYVDGVITAGLFDGRVTTPSRGQTLGINGSAFAVSAEAGYPIPLGWQKLSLEPQVQVVYQHLDFNTGTDVDGILVNMGSPNQGVFRGGFRLTRLFTGDNGMLFTPYLKANVLQGLGGGSAISLSGTSFGTGAFGTALQVGGGVTGTLTHNVSVYADVAWQQNVGGNGGARGWAMNGGVRFAFGEPPPAVTAAASVAPAPQVARSYLVFFDWDKTTLTGRARQIIAEAADTSRHTSVTRILVNGYTDTSGTAAYNQALSVRRAETVAAELVRQGVRRDEISLHGFGDTHLLVQTGAGVREPQNRRVEIVLQ